MGSWERTRKEGEGVMTGGWTDEGRKKRRGNGSHGRKVKAGVKG